MALLVAGILAFFAVVFGTRQVDTTEHQDGLMIAVAVESAIKLVAFVTAGIFITWWMFDGPADLFARAAERADIMRSVGRMIDAGTEPAAASFAAFEPVLAPEGGKLMALRFVFPPYQVGPYADGVRMVEVPTAVLSQHLAPEYRGMFVVMKPAPVADALAPTDPSPTE